MRTAFRAIPATALLGLLALSGCYTVLSHPAGSDIAAGAGYAGGAYRSCSDCHADAAFYHPYYHYGRSHYRWGDYYGFPWWYHDYWWWPPDGDGEGGPPVEAGTRHIWGGGGAGSKGWSFVLPPSKPVSDDARDEQDQGTGQSGSGQEDDSKKKEEGERHLWKPKKKGF